jgi:hypothetical protein
MTTTVWDEEMKTKAATRQRVGVGLALLLTMRLHLRLLNVDDGVEHEAKENKVILVLTLLRQASPNWPANQSVQAEMLIKSKTILKRMNQ